jgi:hypothetical protein
MLMNSNQKIYLLPGSPAITSCLQISKVDFNVFNNFEKFESLSKLFKFRI